jgi:hypothetical protein
MNNSEILMSAGKDETLVAKSGLYIRECTPLYQVPLL